MEALIKKLRECKDRQEAVAILKPFKKSELHQIAAKLFILRQMNKTDMIDRIVESTVGLRLRIEAIKEIDLK